VNHPWIGHVLAKFVHGEGNIWASPAGNEICESNQTSIQSTLLGRFRRFRAISLGEHSSNLRGSQNRIAVTHASAFQQRVDSVALCNFHGSSHRIVFDVHSEEGIQLSESWYIEALAELLDENKPSFVLLVCEDEVVHPNDDSSEFVELRVEK
jgi:hypothetical protein